MKKKKIVMDFYIFAIIWAIPYGGEGGPFPVVNRQYYGHMPMGTIYGWQILGAGIGMAIGGMIPGVIFDRYGNYNIAIYIIVLKFTSSMEIFVKNEYVTYQETGGFVPVFIINQIKEEQYG